MDYPNNFDVPSNPAGKTIAFSRSVAVWISIIFFLIIVACGFMLLGIRFKQNYPFLISVDPFTDEWSVIAFPKNKAEKVQQYQIIQEKLTRDYTTNWFTISSNQGTNEARWEACSIEECAQANQFSPDNIDCAISCRSGEKIFQVFSEKVLPEYLARVDKGGETWNVGRMLITPTKISENGGLWQVFATITSSISGTFNVLSFINISRDVDKYPASFGYYVEDFNAYRIANE